MCAPRHSLVFVCTVHLRHQKATRSHAQCCASMTIPVRYGGHSNEGRCYPFSNLVDFLPVEADTSEEGAVVAVPPPPRPLRQSDTNVKGGGGAGRCRALLHVVWCRPRRVKRIDFQAQPLRNNGPVMMAALLSRPS